MQCPAAGTEAGRSTDFNSLVHAGRNPRFRASTVRPRGLAGKSAGGHVDNRHTASGQSGGASAVP